MAISPRQDLPRVLISGAGIAGSITAYWLAKYGFRVVVVERSRPDQKAGQGLEIEEPALTVVKAMGIFDALCAKRTGEKGFYLMDEHNRSWGRFEIGDGISPTGDLELMRGDLTEILYQAADASPDVTYHFSSSIQSLRQTPEKVSVEIQKRGETAVQQEEFDLVIAADGIKSRTRQLVMGSLEQLGALKPVGASVAYFSIPKQPEDWPYARLCHFPNRRIVWLRPVSEESDFTSVYLIHCRDDNAAIHDAIKSGDRRAQKSAMADVYRDLGWDTPRVIRGMLESDNFYCDELVQVKLPKWSQDRVVLLGDAAWAPTPFTGEGSHLAILGAWTLAQELSRNPDPPVAFANYEKRFRAYVESAQQIPLWGYAPYLFNPQSVWGIWLFRRVFSIVSWVLRHWPKSKSPQKEGPKGDHAPYDLQMETNKSQ